MPSNELDKLAAGDKVAVFNSRGDKLRRIAIVERVTKTTVIAAGIQYRKFNGYSQGKLSMIRPATAADEVFINDQARQLKAAQDEINANRELKIARRNVWLLEQLKQIRALQSEATAFEYLLDTCRKFSHFIQ